MERETAAMTLEMREQLTRDPWMKLQAIGTKFSIGRTFISVQAPSDTPVQPGHRSRGQ
jgi:hypothetical protein